MSTASARGRANRRKGSDAERVLARWLRSTWPDACRAVRNTHPDPGDIDCTGTGLFWSVKNTRAEQITKWMADLADKAAGRLGLLVVKRAGHATPGEWWCWLRLADLMHLVGAKPLVDPSGDDWPLRMELGHVIPLLTAAGYTPAEPGRRTA
jgi:hypothetical protein